MKSIKLRGIVAAVSGAVMFGAAVPAMADSTDDVINALMAKGVLTEEEGALLMKGRAGEKEAAEAKKKSDIKASFKDGIVFQSGDGAFKMGVNGRIQADYRSFDKQYATTEDDTFDIRRAYLGVKGTFYDWVDFEATANFAENKGSQGTSGYKFWINLRPWEQAQFMIGQFDTPMLLEKITSSRFTDFTERSMISQFGPGIDRGFTVHGEPVKGMSYALGMFNGYQTQSDQGQNSVEGAQTTTDGKSINGRVAANLAQFLDNKDNVYHIGGSFSTGNSYGSNPTNTGSNAVNLQGRTEARGLNFFQTNNFNNGFGIDRWGAEGAVAIGPVKLQSEYLNVDYKQNDSNKPLVSSGTQGDKTVKGWYADLTWMLTGEKYADSYQSAESRFVRMKPKNDFNPKGTGNGWGAWELALRYSELDANDFEATDLKSAWGNSKQNKFNQAHAWTGGVKWIINPNTRMLLDYIDTKFDCASGVTCTEDSEKAINFRTQFDF